MFETVSAFLDVLAVDWQIKKVGILTDGAQNMTGCVSGGAVTSLQKDMKDNCPFIQIWCGAHQLKLVMYHVMTEVVKQKFYKVLAGFISHLMQQQNLIANIGLAGYTWPQSALRKNRATLTLTKYG